MIRRIAFALAAAALLLTSGTLAAPRPQRLTNNVSKVLDSNLSAFVSRGDVPGVVAMAATRKGVVYEGAFGLADSARATKMTTDAIFSIASMTKPVTTVAAMQLFEQGRFALDDPAERYLPQLANLKVVESFDAATGDYRVRPASTKVTIRQLMTHTSGLGYGFTSPIVRDFKPRAGDTFEAGPLLFDPGTDWIYGTGIDWIGRLVEKLSGQTLEDYFRDRIFTPLRMTDTSYNVPVEKQARRVTTHMRENGRATAPLTEFPNRPQRPMTTFDGGGGLSSTAGDYVRFMRMIMDGGSLDGARILKKETIDVMSRNQIGNVAVRALRSAQPEFSMDFTFVNDRQDKWGLGFLITSPQVPGKRSTGSLSWAGINNTYFWIDPARGVAGVVMMQFLPFADTKALAVLDTFERGVYQFIDTPG